MAIDTVIPNAGIRPPIDVSGQQPPAAANDAADQQSTQVIAAARDSIIPILYEIGRASCRERV